MTRIRRLSVTLLVAGALGVAVPAAASALPKITISGATASFPLVELLSQKYVKLHPHTVVFKITQGGAQVGVNDVVAGRDTMGDVSRDELPSDPAGLVFQPIAKYAICVITNKANPLPNLTEAQVASIFEGKTRTWSSVGGATASGTIDVISRTSVAGVLTNFTTLLLKGGKVLSGAAEEPSEGLMRQQVENDPNSIGFVSNYQSDKGGVHPVPIGGVGCSRATAVSGQYPVVAHFYEVTKGHPTGVAKAFISFILHNKFANKIINTQWISV